MFEPLYYRDQLILGDPRSAVGVVTLWSRREKIAESVPRDLFAVMGQLYSPTRGLDPLVRNLLANPSIRHIVVTGRDFSGSGQALTDLFEHGAERGRTALGQECWRVRSQVEGYIDIEVSGEAIEDLRRHVTLTRVGEDGLKEALQRLAPLPSQAWGQPRTFEKREHEPTMRPSPDAVHVIRGERVASVWVEVLSRVMRFGRESATHYGSRQKEILDLVSVVTGEDPAAFYLPPFLPFSPAQLEEYLPRVLTGREYHDTSYTYGQRLRTHFGVDQVQAIVDKLAADPGTRSAVAVLWDPRKDNAGHDAPCVNHLWARAREGRVYLTATIRSNDMYSAWPENAFALRRLQELVRAEVSARLKEPLALGELVIMSESAHVYCDCWAAAERIVEQQYESEVAGRVREFDACGSFVITVRDGRIACEHISPAGEHIETYAGRTAAHVMNLLARDAVLSSVSHALYVGRELGKAETALANAGEFLYVQDQQLKRAH